MGNPGPQIGDTLSGDTAKISIRFKLWLLPGHLGLHVFCDQLARRGITVLAVITDPDRVLEESRAACTKWEQGEIHVEPSDPLVMITKSLDPLGLKDWVIPLYPIKVCPSR